MVKERHEKIKVDRVSNKRAFLVQDTIAPVTNGLCIRENIRF